MDYYLFGASDVNAETYDILKSHYNMVGYVDSNESVRRRKKAEGINCIAPADLLSKSNAHVFISGSKCAYMGAQLEALGVSNYSFYPNLEHSVEEKYGVFQNKALGRTIDKKAKNLFMRLAALKLDALGLNETWVRFIERKKWMNFFVYARVVYSCMNVNPDIKTFIDVGGGAGFIQFLALDVGLPSVYYNEIDIDGCASMTKIADALGYDVNNYIYGDIDEIIGFCVRNDILFDAVGSFDVLEHIYDLEIYFNKLPAILSKNAIVCMESGANPHNKPYYDKAIVFHMESEFIRKHNHFDQRYKIIKDTMNQNGITFNEMECIGLAFATRGMDEKDVLKSVKQFVDTGVVPVSDPYGIFKYNTCKLTGNWQEHLINFNKFIKFLQSSGHYSVSEINFYGSRELATWVQLLLRPI